MGCDRALWGGGRVQLHPHLGARQRGVVASAPLTCGFTIAIWNTGKILCIGFVQGGMPKRTKHKDGFRYEHRYRCAQ